MCGHDGRRGYLQHLIVAIDYRNKGIGATLIQKCLSKLEEIGIFKTHIDVLVDNNIANQYWSNRGWVKRTDIFGYSFKNLNDGNI
ncbi:MAG: GNAT family N-acetyltransferase [Gloeocapsa sp. UFS-A4-WI-NPMV-4B04]|jgi:ribosomal protein S18 acetylase RimI-like enzyme|nr:GNAT family N-acetyltransferase [Gloeocapsa sp. UFS-A4-WI-NPMV-4B04]